MALGAFNAASMRSSSNSLDRLMEWLSGGVGVESLPSRPRLNDIDQMSLVSSIATGDVLDISAALLTTGKGLDLSGLAAITSGKGLHVAATGITQTTGVLAHVASAATVLTGAGRLLLSDHTGVTTTSGILNEFLSAANDETIILQVKASAALALGKALNISGALITSGKGLSVDDLDALTTGNAVSITSNSADVTARNLVSIINDHASATGVDLLYIRNDSIGSMSVLENTSGGATGPQVIFYHNSATPAVSDVLARLRFDGEDSGGTQTTYARIDTVLKDATDTTEDALFEFYVQEAGTLTRELTIGMNTITPATAIGGFATVTTQATAGAQTYTAAQLVGGLILRDPNGGAVTDTTATAALLVAAFDNPVVGTTFEVIIRNTADAAETITVAGGTGVTVSGTATIAQNNSKGFLVRLDNVTAAVEAVTMYSLGTVTT